MYENKKYQKVSVLTCQNWLSNVAGILQCDTQTTLRLTDLACYCLHMVQQYAPYAAQRSTAQCSAALHDRVGTSTAEQDIAQRSTVQHSTAQHNRTQNITS